MMEMSQYFVNISDRHYVQIVFLTLFILCFFRGHSLKSPVTVIQLLSIVKCLDLTRGLLPAGQRTASLHTIEKLQKLF